MFEKLIYLAIGLIVGGALGTSFMAILNMNRSREGVPSDSQGDES